MDKPELLALVNVLAKQSKSQYRELMAYKMFAQSLKLQGLDGVDEMIEGARQSAEVRTMQAAYDLAIESMIPSSHEELLDEALQKWLASLPPTDLPN